MDNTIVLIGTINLEIKKLLILALFVSPVTWALDKLTQWKLDNAEYVSWVLGAIIVDHLLGSIYHAFFKRDWSFRENVKGILFKLVIVVSVGYLFEGLNALMIEQSIIKDYTVMVLRLMVFLYPATSAFKNSYVMTGKKFPPLAIMKRLNKFSENAK